MKESFGSLKKINASCSPVDLWEPGESTWERSSAMNGSNYTPLNKHQASSDKDAIEHPLLADRVKYWSDFSSVYYHPTALVQLHESDLDSTTSPFDTWNAGNNLFSTLNRKHDLIDRDVRPLVEEADQLQGFQAFASLYNIWSGFGSSYLEELRDYFPKTPIWLWASQRRLAPLSQERCRWDLINIAKCLVSTSHNVSLIAPLSLNNTIMPSDIPLDYTSEWHTSSLFAAAVETFSLPTRVKLDQGDCETMKNMTTNLFAGTKRNLVNLCINIYGRSGAMSPSLDLSFATETKTYHLPDSDHVFAQLTSSRGFRCSAPNAGHFLINKNKILSNIFSRTYYTELPFPLLDNFPLLFSRGSAAVHAQHHVAVKATLSTDSSFFGKLANLESISSRLAPAHEKEDLVHDLRCLAEEYKTEWSNFIEENEDDF